MALDIPYGIEFVGGIRDGYHQRGLELASDLVDLQFQARVSLDNNQSIDLGLWQGAEISGDFREFGILLGYSHDFKNFTFTSELNYADYESDVIESGVEVTFGVDVPIYENVSIFGQLGYNEASEAIFGQVGTYATAKVSDDSFVTFKSELNIADDYFGRSGLYDVTTRGSFTYNINKQLSVTPFLSLSIPLDNEGDTDFSAGFWMEVFF